MKAGWIGLGEIGGPMAIRVLAAGHELVAYDRGAGKQAVADAGGQLTNDYAEVARGAEVLCVNVFNDAQVRETLLESGALRAMQPGSVLAIHTTGSAVLARELGENSPAGVQVLDACFSGGSAETAAGDLTLMIGGNEAALEKARPILSAYAARMTLLGPLGSGQTLKLLNNLTFATNIMYAARIIELAEAQGLDPLLAAEVIQTSSGASMPMGLFRNAPPAAMMAGARKYLIKDVEAAADAAREAGLDIAAFEPTLRYFSDS